MATGPNSTPIAIDFVSDPEAAVRSIQKVEVALMRMASRVGGAGVAFQTLSRDVAASTMGSSIQATERQVSALTAQVQRLAAAYGNAGRASQGVKPPPAAAGGAAGGAAGAAVGAAAGGGLGAIAQQVLPIASIAGIGAALVTSTKAAMEFQQAMAGIAAVGEIDRTTEAFRELQSVALSGSKQFSSTEKALGLRELVAAGLLGEQAAGAMASTLQLATAGEMSMARAAEILTGTMAAFHMEAEQTPQIVDYMARAANDSLASIDDMGEAMKFAAPVASALKVPLADLSSALAVLASNEIKGGMAAAGWSNDGTAGGTIKEATEAMAEAGIAASQLNPTMNNLGLVMERMGKLDQETLVKLFGAENLDVSNVLASNSEAFAKMQQRMEGAKGAGERFAKTIADTSQGRLKELNNQLAETVRLFGELGKSSVDKMAKPLGGALSNIQTGIADFTDNLATGGVEGLHGLETAPDTIKKLEEGIKAAGAAGDTGKLEKLRTFLDQQTEQWKKIALEAAAMKALHPYLGPSDKQVADAKRMAEQFEKMSTGASGAFDASAQMAENAKRNAILDAEHRAEVERANSAGAAREKFRKQQFVGPLPVLEVDQFDDSKEGASKREAFMNKTLDDSAKQMDAEKKRKQSQLEFNAELAIAEQRAAGDTSTADKLEKELEIMREKLKLMKELGITEAEASGLATRMVTAKDKGKNKEATAMNIVADSMQAIGGGGRFFSPVKGASAGDAAQQAIPLYQEMIKLLQGVEKNTASGGGTLRVTQL